MISSYSYFWLQLKNQIPAINMIQFPRVKGLAKFLILATLFHSTQLLSQNTSHSDTLVLTIQQAEKRFIDSNYLLLAGNYNVDAQKALIQQAKLWDNPVLNTDQVIAANGKFFPYGKNPDGTYSGQYYIQVQQLIKTAGKRGKLINLATTNAKLSELQLQDVIRNLRYQLHTDYYNILQQLGTKVIYQDQMQQLNKLLTGIKNLIAGKRNWFYKTRR